MVRQRLFPATLMPDQDWWHTLWPNPARVIELLNIETGMAVVDLACGDGYFTSAIARRIGSGRVIGIDVDPVILGQAKTACRDLANCNWLLGDALEIDHLIANPVDYVLIANTFHGVPDKLALANKLAAVLRPAGRLAVVNWHPFPREETIVLGQPRGPRTELRMSQPQTRAAVEPAGFELEAMVELPPYHYGAIFKKVAVQR